MKNYTGKTVYLGIDVHKKTYTVTGICEGIVVKKATLAASPEGLIYFCNKYFLGAIVVSAYEAGFSGFHLHRSLEKAGMKNIVVHAAGIEIASGDRVKTDKRDSLKIATQLAAGRLRGIHVPTEEREENRSITRTREMIVEHRTSVAGQIKALLHQHGLIPANSHKKICPKWIRSLENLPIKEKIRASLNVLVRLWLHLTEEIKGFNILIEKQAEEDNRLETIYRSAPGIGPIGARVLANELGDMSYFDNERQLFSYTGLTPSEHSSGGHVRRGHISRQGKPAIRKTLIVASWKAIKIDAGLKDTFNRIAARAGSKRAIVAIGRRLIGHLRACFKKQNLYKLADQTLSPAAA